MLRFLCGRLRQILLLKGISSHKELKMYFEGTGEYHQGGCRVCPRRQTWTASSLQAGPFGSSPTALAQVTQTAPLADAAALSAILKVLLIRLPIILDRPDLISPPFKANRGEHMVTPETMSVAAQHALQDMVELQMYLLSQAQHTPWPMLPRTRTNPFEVKKAHSTSVEVSAARELLDLGFIEASSNRTFVVSKPGYQFYKGMIIRLSA